MLDDMLCLCPSSMHVVMRTCAFFTRKDARSSSATLQSEARRSSFGGNQAHPAHFFNWSIGTVTVTVECECASEPAWCQVKILKYP
jgi:hypothetical protein